MNRVSPVAWLNSLDEIKQLDPSSRMARRQMIFAATFLLEAQGCEECAQKLLDAALMEVAA